LFKKLKIIMDYRICPNPDCMENVPNTTQLFKGKDEVFECVKCGYQEAKQVKVRINKAQARREQEEITVRMVADLIPAPKTPNIYFKESELIEAGREENYRLKSTRNC
jgi:hypothetical protein